MLLDARRWQEGWFRDIVFDVCICGAGPAGITLARALASKGRRVALLEAGDVQISAESQALYDGDIAGEQHYPLDTCRLRYLGGTSNHWEGYTRPLDPRDFESLPHHGLQQWPIRKAELDPYAESAAEILDLGAPDPASDLFAGQEAELEIATHRMSAPTRFGLKYRDELAKSGLITLCLNANLVDIELAPGLSSVSRFLFRSYDNRAPFAVQARAYVICCGGLENARILLNANRQLPQGIGNDTDLVGRFFCEHPEAVVGHAILAAPTRQPINYIARDRFILEQKCLSFLVGVEPLRSGRSARWQHGDRPVCELPPGRRLSGSVLARDPACFDVVVQVITMQALNRDSRVTLSRRRDRFGLRRIALDWRLTDLDWHTMRTAAWEMGRSMAEHDVGRMKLASWLQDAPSSMPDDGIGEGAHHMCTTRMSDDPAYGVVDRNCRVHGIANLYMGGSSVFASGGVSNPTFTIVQLALRLSDHLRVQLG